MNSPTAEHEALARKVADGYDPAYQICLRLSRTAVELLESSKADSQTIHQVWASVFEGDDALMSGQLEKCAEPTQTLTWESLVDTLDEDPEDLESFRAMLHGPDNTIGCE